MFICFMVLCLRLVSARISNRCRTILVNPKGFGEVKRFVIIVVRNFPQASVHFIHIVFGQSTNLHV